jgi:hypothetical protein
MATLLHDLPSIRLCSSSSAIVSPFFIPFNVSRTPRSFLKHVCSKIQNTLSLRLSYLVLRLSPQHQVEVTRTISSKKFPFRMISLLQNRVLGVRDLEFPPHLPAILPFSSYLHSPLKLSDAGAAFRNDGRHVIQCHENISIPSSPHMHDISRLPTWMPISQPGSRDMAFGPSDSV